MNTFANFITDFTTDLIKRKKQYLLLLFAIYINSMGIALGVTASVGATVWTSAFDNFRILFGISAGASTACISLFIFILSKIIGKDFKFKNALGTLTMCIILSFMTDFNINLIGFGKFHNPIESYFFAILGVVLIALAVAIEIKVNICFLALDDFLKNLRICVFKGNTFKASIASLLTATIITLVTGILHGGEITNFYTPITFVSLFIFGNIVDGCLYIVNLIYKTNIFNVSTNEI